jgi:urea transporter
MECTVSMAVSVTAMFVFYAPSLGSGIVATLAGIITVFAQQALSTFLLPFGMPFLTLPFCVVSLPFIIIQGTTSRVVAIPLASATIPEDHQLRIHRLKNGFQYFLEAIEIDRS